MVRISLLAHKFRVKTKKKKTMSSAQNRRLSLGVHSRFRPETKYYSRLGGTSSILSAAWPSGPER